MFNRAWIAVAVLLLTAVALVAAWAWYTFRRTNYTLGQSILYLINSLVTRLIWRTTISGRLPIGPAQGAVIVSNHRSGIDPLLIQVATDRVVHWMVASEYFEYSIMGLVFRTLGSIPVGRRGVDTAATKQAIRWAKEGGLLGLFPEGRINRTDEQLLPGRPGAALIALKARVPVIPVFIEGAPYNGSALGPFLMTARVRVTIGQPIDLSPWFDREKDREVLGELTKRFLKEIAQLAGNASFEPQLAGKNWHPDDEGAAPDTEKEDDETATAES
jgi:1-acyl-sn-glycerol-3-phosphate acyltransferase